MIAIKKNSTSIINVIVRALDPPHSPFFLLLDSKTVEQCIADNN